MVTPDTRAVRLLPQADTLRIAAGLVDFLCAQTWAGTKEIALRHPELPARAIEFLPELIKAATQQKESDTALLLGDYQQLLQQVLVQGPDKVDLSQIPKLCCARWQVPDAKPPASTVIDVMQLARPLVDVETDYFSIPSAEALDTVIEQWSRILQHQGFLHMPLGWRLDALNSAGNSLVTRAAATATSTRPKGSTRALSLDRQWAGLISQNTTIIWDALSTCGMPNGAEAVRTLTAQFKNPSKR
jgi:hypothetical protein